MDPQLSQGVLMHLFTTGEVQPTMAQPTLQVIDIKKIGTAAPQNNAAAPPNDRFRVILSDGLHYQQGMLASQLNHLVSSNKLRTNAVVRLKEFMCSNVAQRKIIVVLNVDILVDTFDHTIGAPANIDHAKGGPAAAPAPQSAMAAPVRPAASASASAPGPSPFAKAAGPPGGPAAPSNPFAQRGASSSTPVKPAPGPSPFAQRGSPAAGGANGMFQPVATLNPYQSRWTIKVRVTHKGEMRHYQNQKGEGKLFSVDLLDAQGGEIRATMFNEAADKFFAIFQQDKVYTVSRGQIKVANKKFSKLNSEYEITLGADSDVQYVGEDSTIEGQRFAFWPISRLEEKQPQDTVDVVGVVTSVGPLSTIMSQKTKKELTKRVLSLTDQDRKSVDLTVWGEEAQKYSEEFLQGAPVIAVKNCRVSDFGGVSLSTTFGGEIYVNPDREEAHTLRHWFDSQGREGGFVSLSSRSGGSSGGGPKLAPTDNRKTLSAIKDEGLGQSSEKADTFTVRAAVTWFIKEHDRKPWYDACPTCNKKVAEDAQGQFYCTKCSKAYPNCNPRYILNALIVDGTGSQWVTAFSERAQDILGVPSTQLKELLDSGNTAAYDAVFAKAAFAQYVFTVRAKAENVLDELRTKCSVEQVTPINFADESRFLLDEIAKYSS